MNLLERLGVIWNNFIGNPNMTVAISVSVLAFTIMYFYMMKFLLDNESGFIISLFAVVMIVAAAILSFVEGINMAIYLVIPAVFVVAIMILYSTEIRRVIWARKRSKLVDVKDGVKYDEEKIQVCTNEIIKALQNMSKNDVGAIIVLSSGNVPGQILNSGVRLDSDISSELIESVFFPKTPLHDGAMVIDGTKIVAAGCFLTLSQNMQNIPKDLGTRHRAGIGVTETMDVMSIIVSEESGIISIARAGKITRYADYEMLKKTLNKYYWQELESSRR